MKPKSFLLSILFLPYLIWVLAVIFSLFLVWILIYTIGLIPGVANLLLALYAFAAVYAGGGIFAGIPYTFFVVGFLFWSKNKSEKNIYSALIYSPLIVAFISALVLITIGLISRFASGIFPPMKDLINLGQISLFGVVLILIYGYILVGVGIVGYKTFDSRKWLKRDNEAPQDALDNIPTKNNS
ncbi:MAG: hypothetical protein KF758_18575 [Anaerolineales bacterium]|nr:hypothetical protein [Anaerolineales bacterium]